MHRQCCKGSKSVAVVLDLLINVIVTSACFLFRFSFVDDALNAGDCQRDKGMSDAMFVGQLYAIKLFEDQGVFTGIAVAYFDSATAKKLYDIE